MPASAPKRVVRRNLRAELEQALSQVSELQSTLRAIRSGEIDGIVIDGPSGSRLFTLQSPDQPYRILAERMNEGAATLHVDGTVLFCNHKLAEMLQFRSEQIVGTPIVSNFVVDEQAKFLEWIKLAQHHSLRTEAHLLCQDATCLTVQLSLSQIPLADSEPGICMVAADISTQKRAEKEIRQLNEELEHRVGIRTEELNGLNAELEAFTYGVAHDLRAPIRHIHGFSEILLNNEKPAPNPENQRYLTLILQECSRMETLIQALLRLSKLGRQPVRLCPTQLSALVAEVRDSFCSESSNRRIEWKIGELPEVSCDPDLMKIVFVNLLSNAIKFTRHRDPATIAVKAGIDGRQNSVFRSGQRCRVRHEICGQVVRPFSTIASNRGL